MSRHPTPPHPDDEPGGPFLPDEPEVHASDLLEKIRRRWRLVAVCVLVALAAGAVHYAITPKQYQAKARIQIERRSLTPLAGNANPWLENWWNMEYYPTQYQLLESRGLAERVVLRLGLAEDPGFNPGGKALAPPESRLDPDSADSEVLGRLASRLLGGLQVVPIKSTQLVDIVYRSDDPEFAARIANGFAQAFIDWGIDTRSDTAGRASTFLTNQIESLTGEISSQEEELAELDTTTSYLPSAPEANVNIQRFEVLNQDYTQAKADRIQKRAAYEALLATPDEDVADQASEGMVSELTREQLQLERDYQNQLQTFKPDHPTMVQLRAEIEQGRRSLDKLIAENVDKARKGALAEAETALRRERALEAELESLKSQMRSQSGAAVERTNLRVELASNRDLLDKLVRQQSETEVTAQLQGTRESNVRVVDRALVPGGPFRPSLEKDLSSALLAGLGLGLGLVFLLDYMDRTLKTPEEVERQLGLPNLAVIPDVGSAGGTYGRPAYGYGTGGGSRKGGKHGVRRLVEKIDRKVGGGDDPDRIELLPHERPRLAVSEAYRALRTALLLSSAEKLELVAVTSAGAGEGKTATSVNLAIVMAQLGRRVLLIDGDLRKPRLHEVFGVSNRRGLVNVLAGGEDPAQTIVPTSVAGLSLLPCGPAPPNPSELLASERMRELARRARTRFDIVVIDTPPVLAVTDAVLIGALADGVVLCLRAHKVLRDEARACRDRLALAEIKVLGTVLNRHRQGGGHRGGGYYGYYGTYGELPDEVTDDEADSAA